MQRPFCRAAQQIVSGETRLRVLHQVFILSGCRGLARPPEPNRSTASFFFLTTLETLLYCHKLMRQKQGGSGIPFIKLQRDFPVLSL